jgi:hypothetical protein
VEGAVQASSQAWAKTENQSMPRILELASRVQKIAVALSATCQPTGTEFILLALPFGRPYFLRAAAITHSFVFMQLVFDPLGARCGTKNASEGQER